jgi:hypothetical protein
MLYGFLADMIVALHMVYVCVVVFGLPAILIGGPLGWKWVRNRWFRVIHLTMILIVVGETLAGWPCLLDIWESHLRLWAGQDPASKNFIHRTLEPMFRFPLPQWVFNTVYFGAALFILALFRITPVCWHPDRDKERKVGQAG